MEFFFHTRTGGKSDWDNEGIKVSSLARLPNVGEYIQLTNERFKNHWHRVDLIVHVAFKADYVAEVYCTKMEPNDVMAGAGNTSL